ncbi:hypothetical protein ACIBCB_21860 [Streptomyces uncialis]|uniref:hypothetical protein n=1 Tax=Streptomyces uncialis TaxID=1048205 RepID=UPI0037A1F61E
MTDSTPEEGEPTSLTSKAKAFCKEHKGKLIAAGTVVLLAAAVVIKQTVEQNVIDTQSTDDVEESGETEDTASNSASDEPQKRRAEHDVKGHERTLSDGRVIPAPVS